MKRQKPVLTPEARVIEIAHLADKFEQELKSYGVESYIISTSYDDMPESGHGRTRAQGVDYVIAQMLEVIAATLPPLTFQRLLVSLAMSPDHAVQRGEIVNPIDMKKVN